MRIEHVDIPMGPGSAGRVLGVLRRTLDPAAPCFPQLLREVACRVDRDLGRLPWAEAVLTWLEGQSPEVHRACLKHLWEISAKDPAHEAARGATLILLAWADTASDFDDRVLFDLACQAASAEIRRMVGAWLLATTRTRSRALSDLEKVPAIADLVHRQKQVQQGMGAWQGLVREVSTNRESANSGILFLQIEAQPELHFELRNGLLDVFDGLAAGERRTLAQFLLHDLDARHELVQRFVLDLLQYRPFLEAARQGLGYRLERTLRRLEQTSPSAQVRNYAAALLTQWEVGAASEMRAAARGNPAILDIMDRRSVVEAVRAARLWFSELDVTKVASISHEPSWKPEDYAHAALQLLGTERTFPVDLERLCRILGCFVHEADLPEGLDGLLIQRYGLPGPVILYNAMPGERRKRFTVAHELGHAVMPRHTGYIIHTSNVSEPAEPRRLGETERSVSAVPDVPRSVNPAWEAEADRFAAALLMPRRWFGEAVRRTPMTLQGLEGLAEAFGVSVTAAAFQAIRLTRDAVAVVYSVDGVVRFERMADDFRDMVGPAASVLEWVGKGTVAERLRGVNRLGTSDEDIVPATVWLDRPQVKYLHEQSLVTHADHILSLLTPVEGD